MADTSVPPAAIGDSSCCREVMARYDAFFAAFVTRVLGTRPPELCTMHSSPVAGNAFNLDTEAGWRDQTLACVGGADLHHVAERHIRRARLSQAVDRLAMEIASGNLGEFLAARIDIASPGNFVPTPHEDFYYLKINHGFWEQLFALFSTSERIQSRIADATTYREQYLTSCFLEALDAMVRDAASDDGRVVRFPRVQFGVSLSNGDFEHRDVLADVPKNPFLQQVVQGAAIGVTSYFESLFGARRLSFCDGSFPKHGLRTGVLRQCLHSFASASDLVIFVVPPHLRRIRIVGATVPHEHLSLSGSMVHESWLVSLYFTVRRILQRLAVEGRVMVVTQSAVFSALLGLFLRAAKDAIVPQSTLSFFDLGQVTDVADPRAGGPWGQRHAPRDTNLFELSKGNAIAEIQ